MTSATKCTPTSGSVPGVARAFDEEELDDACLGDSGGALYVPRARQPPLLVGIVSWGYKCGSKKHPGVYTRVSGHDWIVSVSDGALRDSLLALRAPAVGGARSRTPRPADSHGETCQDWDGYDCAVGYIDRPSSASRTRASLADDKKDLLENCPGASTSTSPGDIHRRRRRSAPTRRADTPEEESNSPVPWCSVGAGEQEHAKEAVQRVRGDRCSVRRR